VISEQAFNDLVEEIRAQGHSQETAAHYAALIGDTPLVDQEGKFLVRDGRQVVARLEPLKFFDVERL
jgi:hypothetical protein